MQSDLFEEARSTPVCGSLPLDANHVMHWEQSGRVDGQAAVLLHGGPGAGLDTWQRRLFDPRHYRIVCYDQRGAGRSTPSAALGNAPGAALVNNTTAHLVADLDALRAHLGIERWLLFGGSWGSALALAYAVRHPERASALILRGVFLGLAREIDWYLDGLGNVFPEAWRRFVGFLPDAERDAPLAAYHRRVHDPVPSRHEPTARAWCAYEASCSALLPEPLPSSRLDVRQALTLARIQTHYFVNGCFVAETPLLDAVARLRSIPGIIVQGRYDMICPPRSAEALHRAWPGSRLGIVPNAGHSAREPGVRRALVAATEHCKSVS